MKEVILFEGKLFKKIRNREKMYHFQGMTSRAITDGKLIKMPCEICGNILSIAHHEDYMDYLNIRWLCYSHHQKLHLLLKKYKITKMGFTQRKNREDAPTVNGVGRTV